MTALQFDLSGLRDKVSLSFERRVEPQSLQPLLGGSAVLTGPLLVRLSVLRRGAGVSFQGTVAGEWELACVRCLGPARMPLHAGVEGEAPQGAALDAAESVRQALLLALPMSAHCRPDCKGLCPHCGGNRNDRDCGCQPPKFSARRTDA